MIAWNVRPTAGKHGVSNAHQLAAKASLTLPLAYRIWGDRAMERIDVNALEAMARAFRCSPWRLLTYRKD